MSQPEDTVPPKTTATQKIKQLGAQVFDIGKKAVDSTKEFVADTEEDIKMTKTMQGLVHMALKEFEVYIKQKQNNLTEIGTSFLSVN